MNYSDIPGIVDNDYAKSVLSDFDSKIDELRRRRSKVESKCLIRQKTLKEVVSTTNTSVSKLCEEVERDNRQADQRYARLLSEIDRVMALTTSSAFLSGETGPGVYNPYASATYNASITSSKLYLQNAMKSYKKSVQLLLPAWKRQQVNSLEDEVKSIQVEKNSINYRKQVMFSEYERERLVKAELERERTQLILLRAQESAAQSILYNATPTADIFLAEASAKEAYPGDFFAFPPSAPSPTLSLIHPSAADTSGKENCASLNCKYNPRVEETPAKTSSSSAVAGSPALGLGEEKSSMLGPMGISVPSTLEDFLEQAQTPSKRISASQPYLSKPPTPSPSKTSTAEAAAAPDSGKSDDAVAALRSNVDALSIFECVSVAEKLFALIEKLVEKDSASPGDRDRDSFFGYRGDGQGGVSSLNNADAAIVDLVISAAKINRNAELDTYDFRYLVAAASTVIQSRASDLISPDLMHGLVTLDKLKKEHKRSGPGRSELWNGLAMHIHNLAQIDKDDDAVEGLIGALTGLLSIHIDDADDRTRVRRKVNRLLCGAAQFSKATPVSAPAAAPTVPPKNNSPPKLPPKTHLSYDKILVATATTDPREFDDEINEPEEQQRPSVKDIDALVGVPQQQQIELAASKSAIPNMKAKGKKGQKMAVRTVVRSRDLNDF